MGEVIGFPVRPDRPSQVKTPPDASTPIQEQPSIGLLITMQPNGSINVQGPIPNKVLCYGLLEAARDIIQSYKSSDIITPDPGIRKDLGL
jgi:hypothetical protein